MTLRLFRSPAAFVISTALLATSALAQSLPGTPQSTYGGVPVEQIIARINDQIITSSDYDRAMKELDDEAREHNASMHDISSAHSDLLRNLIDQQLWLSKGKELSINGETELITKLDEIRKQYHLETLEDLEKEAKDQGVSFEDFKAHIRNQIITQLVMRQEVGQRVHMTPGEVRRYFEEHKQDYALPESVTLAEILVSTGTSDDPATLAAAQAKANDIEAKLHAGGDFSQLAHSFSDGPTAAEGGDLGDFRRGALAKVLEDSTFSLKSGEYTAPIRTRQGFVILKVVKHTPGGVPEFKDVENEVDDAYFTTRMEPAIRDYLTKMREQAFIEIKPGYIDTGASPNKSVFPIAYAAYTPPVAKKKKKVERTRFHESTRTFRQKKKTTQTASAAPPAEPVAGPAKKGKGKKKASRKDEATMKPGKKEKIRYGQPAEKSLGNGPSGVTEDAGAGDKTASAGSEPVNPLESKPHTQKTRLTARAKVARQIKVAREAKVDAMAPAAPEAAEVADRQTQAAPHGLAGDTATKKKKKTATTTGDKTRFADKNVAQNASAKAKAKSEKPAKDPADVHGW
jgi:peptidyl-prolyl cis-trans isomerase SurA